MPTVYASNESDTCFTIEIIQTILSEEADAEEYESGRVLLNSSDLELVEDNIGGNQTIGLQFTNLPLAQGVTIVEAYLQFTTDDETSTGISNLVIATEASDNAAPFEATPFNISNRIRSQTKTTWSPDSWLTIGEKGLAQRTPNLKDLLQEVVDRPNWQAGNAAVFLLKGSGQRIAAAYELDPNKAAQLIIKIAYPQPDTLIENVFINELMAANTLYVDEYGEADDWVEIYNANPHPLFLGGLYLTDDLEDLQKWQITNSTLIPPKEFGLIWADGQLEQGGHHAPFKLKSSGEAVALVQELNGTLHILDSITFPAIPANFSYGRTVDGEGTWAILSKPSLKASNKGASQQFEANILFSEQGGIYEEPVFLEMTTTEPDIEIRYTLDGSIPTIESAVYQEPIVLNETYQVQARAFKIGFIGTTTTTAFFLINEPSQIPVLNIQSDPTNLWDEQIGIYVKGKNGAVSYCDDIANNWNQEWERPCQLTFYEPDGSDGFQVNAGMKIGGACSRNLKMKSFNFFLRNKDYGEELIDYPIFPNQTLTEFRRIKIRNGGTDWLEMLFRDGMNHHLLANTVDLDLVAYRPVRVYLNGQYWGVYGIREMLNKHYIASHHGVDADSVDILGDPYGPRSQVREGDDEAWDIFANLVSTKGVSQEEDYIAIQEMMDLQQYLNYYIVQIYLANFDWPGNNVRVWRDRNNGKFRWMLFDTDTSAGWDSWGATVAKANHNSLAHSLNTNNVRGVPGFEQWPNGPESTFIFRQLMKNEDFKNEFIQRTCTFRELLFSPDRVFPMVDSMEQLLLPEIGRHIQKWTGNNQLGQGRPSGGSVPAWRNILSSYKNFFSSRAFHILSIYEKELDLAGTFDLAINTMSNKGKVVLHQNEMAIPTTYVGKYFKNVPITIKAIPEEGYYFSHWLETGNTNSEVQFSSTVDTTLTPIFTSQAVSVYDEELDHQIVVFPNPTADFITIQLEEDILEPIQLKLYNSLGQEVLEPRSTDATSTISVKQLPKGIYWLSVERLGVENRSLVSRRIVVR